MKYINLIFLFIAFNLGVYFFLSSSFINPDGIGYVSYLPTVLFQRTFNFFPFYHFFHLQIPDAITAPGWPVNIWSFGSAFLWSPVYGLGKLGQIIAGQRMLPFNATDMALINSSSMLLGLGAFWFMVDSSRRFNLPGRALASLTAFFGTPLFFYAFMAGTTSHAASAFMTGGAVWFWISTRNVKDFLRWFCLGILCGIAAMVRPQEGLVLILPFWDIIARRWREKEIPSPVFKAAGGVFLGFIVGFFPQALIWRMMYGSFFHAPSAFNLRWNYFALPEILFSSFHGLLTWTPLFLLSVIGLMWDMKGEGGPLLAFLLAQIFLNSFSLAWWEGFSFGLRQMTGSAVVVSIGIGFFLKMADQRFKGNFARRWARLGVVLCALWTLLLSLNAIAGSLQLLFYVSPASLISLSWKWENLFQGLYAKWAGFSQPFSSLFLILLFVEMMGLAIFLRFNNFLEKNKIPLILGGAVFLLAVSDFSIAVAGFSAQSPVHGLALNEKELDFFFKSQVDYVYAEYYAARGINDKSMEYRQKAIKFLPESPLTEPWRQKFRQ